MDVYEARVALLSDAIEPQHRYLSPILPDFTSPISMHIY